MFRYNNGIFLLFVCLHGLQYTSTDSSKLTTVVEKLLSTGEPLELEVCKNLGYNSTTKINFLKENQRNAKNNAKFKALMRLSRTGCSPLVKNFACTLFAPPLLPDSGVLPPCKSFCHALTKSCAFYLRWASLFSSFSGSCKLTKKGELFRGSASRTREGIECQEWSSQSPHSHSFTSERHPKKDLVNNYCRNPDGEPEGPWCYTTSKKKRWDYCRVPMCSVHLHCDLLSDKGCIHYVYDNMAGDYKLEVKGTPSQSQLKKWISEFSKDELEKIYTLT